MEVPSPIAGRRRLMLAALVANGLGQAAVATTTALLVRGAFDHLVRRAASASMGDLLVFGGGLSVAALAGACLRARERTDAERLGQHYVHRVRMLLYRRLVTLTPRTLQRRSHGAVVLRFVGDLTALRQWVCLGLARVAVTTTATLGALAALAVVSPALAAGVAAVLVAGMAASLALGAAMRSAALEARRRRSRLAANVNEKVAAVAVVQAFGQGERERRRLARQSRTLSRAMVQRARTAGRLRGTMELTASLAAAAALVLGAWEVHSGRTSPGTVVAAMFIVGLLVPRFRELGRVQEFWHNSRVALARLRDFLETPSSVVDAPDATDLADGPGRLELRKVTVAGALDDVSATAEPGTVVAITGPNGAGKSTLLSLLARLAAPDRGTVLLDGQDLARRTATSVRRAIGIAGPEFPLLRGSVGRNLTYRCPDADEAERARVLELCELGDLLAALEDGLATRLADGGRGLSTGQRQRLALARALLGRPRILLLDEVESNLDAAARRAMERAIAAARGGSTVLLVTHDSELIDAADVVWRLEAGRIVEVRRPRGAHRWARGSLLAAVR